MFVVLYTYDPLLRIWGPYTTFEEATARKKIVMGDNLPDHYVSIIRLTKDEK